MLANCLGIFDPQLMQPVQRAPLVAQNLLDPIQRLT
jgi:hypothetical protein